MGTWGPGVGDDDVFVDVYQDFIDMYNEGQDPAYVAETIRDEFRFHFANPDDYSSALFALALASWETQVLDDELLAEVTAYITSDKDPENLRSRDATSAHIAERRANLKKFLKKLTEPRSSKKRRVKPKVEVVRLVELMSPDDRKEILATRSYLQGKYYGTVVVVVWRERGGGGLQFLETMDEELDVEARWENDLELHIRFSHLIDLAQLPTSVNFYGASIRVVYEIKS